MSKTTTTREKIYQPRKIVYEGLSRNRIRAWFPVRIQAFFFWGIDSHFWILFRIRAKTIGYAMPLLGFCSVYWNRIGKKKIGKFLAFLHSKLFYKEFHQIYSKMWTKKMLTKGNQIHNFILCVCENFSDTILVRFRLRLFDMLQFRFRFHTAKSFGFYGSGSRFHNTG